MSSRESSVGVLSNSVGVGLCVRILSDSVVDPVLVVEVLESDATPVKH